MEKLHFCEEEVLGFLEDIIQSGEANQDEVEFYEDYRLFGKLHKMNHIYKGLVMQMRELFETTY